MAEKANKLRELSLNELRTKLEDAREELMKLRFQQATGELTDLMRIRYTRREIARLLTIIHEKELEASTEGEK